MAYIVTSTVWPILSALHGIQTQRMPSLIRSESVLFQFVHFGIVSSLQVHMCEQTDPWTDDSKPTEWRSE